MRNVWLAIALHTTPGVPNRMAPEIALVTAGVVDTIDLGDAAGDFEQVALDAMTYDGQLYAFEQHMARLERSGTNLRLTIDSEAVRADAYRLLAEAGGGPDHDLLRIVITRGGRRLLMTEGLRMPLSVPAFAMVGMGAMVGGGTGALMAQW